MGRVIGWLVGLFIVWGFAILCGRLSALMNKKKEEQAQKKVELKQQKRESERIAELEQKRKKQERIEQKRNDPDWICPKCSSNNLGKDHFCPNCGYKR